MKRLSIIAIALTLFGSGCASTHQVSLSGGRRWIAQAQVDLVGSRGTVFLADGRSAEGIVSRLSPDSIWVSDGDGRPQWGGPLRTVRSIRQPRKYTLFGAGVVGGAIAGAWISRLVSEETKSVPGSGVEVVTYSGGIGLGVAYGGVLGGLIMAALTRVDEYYVLPGGPEIGCATGRPRVVSGTR